MLLQAMGLSQRFGDSVVLRNIDLEVKRREVFVVIGPTGCGKTTLLRLLGLLDSPASGTIRFGGREVGGSEKERRELRRRMAFVFQKPVVFSTSVYNNVAYGLRIRGVGKSLERERVSNALETVRLAGFEKRDARTLSGGEVQRVALARAMVVEPELLLLDEPTANLDPRTTLHVEELLSKVIGKLNTTVLMSTHDLFQGQRLADRMSVIVDGEMLQTGTPRELFNLPRGRKIAEFVGTENILEGEIAANDGGMVEVRVGDAMLEGISNLSPGHPVYACVRPEEIVLARERDGTSARNALAARITRVTPQGPFASIEMDCGFALVALITRRSAEDMELQAGSRVYASFKATGVHIIER